MCPVFKGFGVHIFLEHVKFVLYLQLLWWVEPILMEQRNQWVGMDSYGPLDQ
jgi:hypothetical protein